MRLTEEFKGKIYKYLQEKIGLRPYRKSWYKPDKCPYCGREGKFGVNLSQNRCNCFVCGEHPSLIDLVMFLENVNTYPEVLRILGQDKWSGAFYKEDKVELKERKLLYLPDGFKLIDQGDSTLAKSIRGYIHKRGFDIPNLAKMGWGYGTKGIYMGYLIIPFYENHQLVYFNARRVLGNGPKYKNPDTSVTGLGKSFIIYNVDALNLYKTIYLCEGAINAQTMGNNGIASCGKNISRYQVNSILKSKAEHIIILFDPDAKDKALQLGMKLLPHKKVKVVFLPEGKDVNDLGRSTTLRYVYNTPYQNLQELLSIKNQLNNHIKIL